MDSFGKMNPFTTRDQADMNPLLNSLDVIRLMIQQITVPTTRVELKNQVWEINGRTKFQIHSAITPANSSRFWSSSRSDNITSH